MQDEPAIEPGYERIPRDAAGNPIFLILSDADQQRYDRWMESCEAGWRETQDPFAITEAHTLTTIYRQVPPAWLDEAVFLLACNGRTKEDAKRALEARVRFQRYSAVRSAKARGLSWKKARDDAAAALAKTSAAGKPGTMWEAYKAVRRDIKAGRRGKYFEPHRQRRDQSGKPIRTPQA
ncbi:MAG TPA: hypothetical protein VGG86_17330 [Roseiarcus sp.]|jgi:hypothetical protein